MEYRTVVEAISMATTVTSKGQVTVPKAVRDYLGIKAGSAVTFERLPSGEVVLRAAKPGTKGRASVFAKLRGRATVRMRTEDMMALTRGA
jgi:AbrB family looped-hinge helix DNA binding protein